MRAWSSPCQCSGACTTTTARRRDATGWRGEPARRLPVDLAEDRSRWGPLESVGADRWDDAAADVRAFARGTAQAGAGCGGVATLRAGGDCTLPVANGSTPTAPSLATAVATVEVALGTRFTDCVIAASSRTDEVAACAVAADDAAALTTTAVVGTVRASGAGHRPAAGRGRADDVASGIVLAEDPVATPAGTADVADRSSRAGDDPTPSTRAVDAAVLPWLARAVDRRAVENDRSASRSASARLAGGAAPGHASASAHAWRACRASQ